MSDAAVIETTGRCTDGACPLATGIDGACLLAHADPIDCHAFIPTVNDKAPLGPIAETSTPAALSQKPQDNDQPDTAESNLVFIQHGNAMSPREVNTFLRRKHGLVITFLGPINTGKTTLITSIYEQYCNGPVGSSLFAASQTLVGFEERRHGALAHSGDSPSTERTPKGASQLFLHLAVKEHVDASIADLLFADVSGEVYDDIMINSDPGALGDVLERTDLLVCVCDGSALANAATRQREVSRVRYLLRTLRERQLTPIATPLIAITKWDNAKANEDEIVVFIDTNKTRWEAEWSGPLSIVQTAARNTESGEVNEGFGVEELVNVFLKHRWVQRQFLEPGHWQSQGTERSFWRYQNHAPVPDGRTSMRS